MNNVWFFYVLYEILHTVVNQKMLKVPRGPVLFELFIRTYLNSNTLNYNTRGIVQIELFAFICI